MFEIERNKDVAFKPPRGTVMGAAFLLATPAIAAAVVAVGIRELAKALERDGRLRK